MRTGCTVLWRDWAEGSWCYVGEQEPARAVERVVIERGLRPTVDGLVIRVIPDDELLKTRTEVTVEALVAKDLS